MQIVSTNRTGKLPLDAAAPLLLDVATLAMG